MSRARSAPAPSETRSSLKSSPSGTMTVMVTPARAQRRARRSAARSPSTSLSRAMTRRAMPAAGAKPERREPATRQAAGAEIGLCVGAADRPALPPQAARRFGGVIRAAESRRRRRPRIGVRGRLQGEEGARLVERRAQRRRAGAVTDEIEQVAVFGGRGVGPAARDAGTVETDEQRSPAGAVEIARDPVAALSSAMGKIAPADGLGLQAERRGDGGGVHGAAPAGRRKRDEWCGMRSLLQREGRPAAGQNRNGRAGGAGHRPDRRPATVLHVQGQLRRQNGAVVGTRIVTLKMPPENDTIAAAGRPGRRWRLEVLSKKGPAPKRRPPSWEGGTTGGHP